MIAHPAISTTSEDLTQIERMRASSDGHGFVSNIAN